MRSRTVARPTGRARSLAAAGPATACGFMIGTVAAALTWPEYDHRVQPLSDLGGTAAPVPVIQNVTFVVFAAAVVALGAGLSARLGCPVAALVVGFGTADFMRVIGLNLHPQEGGLSAPEPPASRQIVDDNPSAR